MDDGEDSSSFGFVPIYHLGSAIYDGVVITGDGPEEIMSTKRDSNSESARYRMPIC